MAYETRIILGGAKVSADFTSLSQCRKCPAQIVWGVTQNGKNIPLAQDEAGRWMAHMATCTGWKRGIHQAPYFKESRNDLAADLNRQKEREGW